MIAFILIGEIHDRVFLGQIHDFLYNTLLYCTVLLLIGYVCPMSISRTVGLLVCNQLVKPIKMK